MKYQIDLVRCNKEYNTIIGYKLLGRMNKLRLMSFSNVLIFVGLDIAFDATLEQILSHGFC